MLTPLKLALSNLWEGVNHSFEYILLVKIAVIINEDFEEVLGVLTEFVENIQNQVFVVVVGISGVQYLQEDLLYKDHYFLLQVLSEVKE